MLEAEDQLKIAKKQITDLKKKLTKAEGAKNVAEWARDEALKAKEKAVFARSEAERSKEKAEEEALDLGVAKTQATLKAQVPGVCRLYCSQVWNEALKQARVKASSNLWRWRMYTTLLPSGKLPPPTLRLGMLLRRLRLLVLELFSP